MCGVPQGSILGPLLFILCVNELPNHIKQKMVFFTDDTSMVVRCSDVNKYESGLNKALSDTVQWLSLNNLVRNLDKA